MKAEPAKAEEEGEREREGSSRAKQQDPDAHRKEQEKQIFFKPAARKEPCMVLYNTQKTGIQLMMVVGGYILEEKREGSSCGEQREMEKGQETYFLDSERAVNQTHNMEVGAGH